MFSFIINENELKFLSTYLDEKLDNLIDELDNVDSEESKDFYISELYLCNHIKKRLKDCCNEPIYFN